MADKTQRTMATEGLAVIADRGYFKGEEIKACVDAGMTPYVPKSLTSGNHAAGLYDRRDFHYIEKEDVYRCPAGERLPKRTTSHEKGRILYRYWSSQCHSCPLKSKCTTGKERRETRWEHEAVLDAAEARRDRDPDKMRLRKEVVEHPFGTIKYWMGETHFQMKTLKHVSTEMSLHVLAYNLKRVMNIMGIKPLIQAIQA